MEQLRQQLARLEKSKQDTAARFARIGDMQAGIAAVEARATSPDRVVTVVAGPGGTITSVTFSEDAQRYSPTQLSQATMTALRQAVAESGRRQAEVLRDHLGDAYDLTDRVREAREAGYAEPAQTEPQPAAGRSTSTPASVPQTGGRRPILREGW